MDVAGCPLPEDRLYDVEESTWARPEAEGRLWTLGLTAARAAFSGRFVAVTYRPVDTELAAGRSVATLESLRLTGPVRLPASGAVVERNLALLARPKLLNDDPYGEGWLVRVRPSPAVWAGPPLETAGAIAERLRARIRDLHIHCLPAAPDAELIELGTECAATLARVDEELARLPAGSVLLLVSDDPTSPIEIVRWSDRTGETVLAHLPEPPLHKFLLRKEANPVPRRRAAATGRV